MLFLSNNTVSELPHMDEEITDLIFAKQVNTWIKAKS